MKGRLIFLITSLFVVILALVIALLTSSLHRIDEGNVGIYYKYGALQNSVGFPGLNTQTPFVSSHIQVTVRPLKDNLYDFKAVTKDAIPIEFNNVEVISSVAQGNVLYLVRKFGIDFRTVLIFDRLREEIRRYCFTHEIDDVYNERFVEMSENVIKATTENIQRLADGKIEIINLIIPKPDIPRDIAENYQRVKVQWTEKLVAEKEREKEEVRKQTEEMKAVADARRQKAVKVIELEKQILQKEAEKNMSMIENERYRLAEENKAQVLYFTRQKESEGNQLLFTDKYVKMKLAEVFSNNTKLYFSGENSPLGAIFSKLVN